MGKLELKNGPVGIKIGQVGIKNGPVEIKIRGNEWPSWGQDGQFGVKNGQVGVTRPIAISRVLRAISDRQTDQRTDRRTEWLIELRARD